MWFAVPAAVLLACLAGGFATRGVMANLPFLAGQGDAGGTGAGGLVDQSPFLTAQTLAGQAVSAEEQELAREAERLADHEVDQAFAMALRQAELETRHLTGAALALQQKVNGLALLVKEDQARVDGLTARSGGSASSGAVGAASGSDDLEVAKAQLQLESDELADAQQDLARESGDKRGQIQQELTARQAAMQKYDSQAKGGQTAVASEQRFGTLAGRLGGWFNQRRREKLLEQAKAQAEANVAALQSAHGAVEERSSEEAVKLHQGGAAAAVTETVASDSTGDAGGAAAADRGDGAAKNSIVRMRQMHALAQIHSILDDRQTTERQLAEVYTRWIAQVWLQHRILEHLILQSCAWIAGIVLAGIVTWWGVRRLLVRASQRHTTMDSRTLSTLETVARLAIQVVTLVLVLLVIFGAPDHTPTILGLATAGLTVVFQDFILAFFGWFVLMGRNGIRVGDWVEINAVGGEVVEIGLFRTTLLETGNWTDKGHPTGRRVTFINSFAIRGQYFNFSTAGQWMWDEISLNVPPGEGTYETIEAIHKAVLQQTSENASLAEAEWKGATKQRGLSQFSAKPSVDLRPAASGIDVLVRYITRAGDRFEIRNKLYSTMIELLHKPAGGPERAQAG
ncbi:MAG: mechanosensitive ion channel [Acidobacteriota bacterium]|nr:mechanosensitive ion channel [Acidobacteriota bacterium]